MPHNMDPDRMVVSKATILQSRTNPGSVEAIAARRARVFDMRKTGMRVQEIAIEEGIHVSVVNEDIKIVLLELREYRLDMAMDYVILELERLDALQVAIWAAAANGHLPSQDRVLLIMRQRANLLGLDAPVKVDLFDTTHQNEITVQYVNDWRKPEQQSKADPAISPPGPDDSTVTEPAFQLASGWAEMAEDHLSDADRSRSSTQGSANNMGGTDLPTS